MTVMGNSREYTAQAERWIPGSPLARRPGMTECRRLKTSANKRRDDARSGIGPAARRHACSIHTRTQNPADAVRRSLRLIGAALTLNGVLFLLGSFATGQWLLDSAGRLADSDFVDVWAAGKLALDGNAAAAWDWAIHRDAEVAALGHDFPGNYGWHLSADVPVRRRGARHAALPCSLARLARRHLARCTSPRSAPSWASASASSSPARSPP